MFKKSLLFMFAISTLLGNEKSGAFFAIGGGYTPKIPYQVSAPDNSTAISSVPLYAVNLMRDIALQKHDLYPLVWEAIYSLTSAHQKVVWGFLQEVR